MMVAEEAKLESFFKLWTAKEAFIKATGEGLSRGLDSFVIRDGLTDRPFVQEVGRESKIVTDSCWSLSRPPAPAGWAAALAHNSRSPVQVLSFDWSQLKNKLY
jgi:4'-phosphopantetheinyl transferase